ncbi:MAG: hypothetical protein J6Q89_04065 [Clostridia bacterium]|nr:hypothetical protein [Clostridia bacterium]
MKIRKIFSYVADTVLLFIFIYLIVSPQNASEPTRNALDFCAKTLVPSLFIYMVLSKTLLSLPITEKIAKYIGVAPIALIIGTLCGAPIGAKNAVSLYESGKTDKKYAEYLCSFTNNASVSFVVGFVGKELFGDICIGLKLLCFQIISSLITAIIMKRVIYGKTKPQKANFTKTSKIGLREAVTDSALTMINLCACVIFFIVVGSAVSHIVHLPNELDAILKSVLEFSSGCAAAAKSDKFAVPICAFAIGSTGLSVALQVRSVIANKLAMMPFLTGKLISGAIMTFLAFIFG